MLSRGFILISLVCSVLSLLLSSVALISANTAGKVMESLYWGFARYDYGYGVIYYYIGVFGYCTKDASQSCRVSFYDQCGGDDCQTCMNTMSIVIGFLAVFIFVILFTIGFDITRLFGLNSCLTKSLGIASSILAILMGLISLIVFASTCMAKVVNSLGKTNVEYHYGSSFGLLATSVCLVFVGLIINSLVGVGDAAARSIGQCCGPESCCYDPECCCCGDNNSSRVYQQPALQTAVYNTQPNAAVGLPYASQAGVQYGQLQPQSAVEAVYLSPQGNRAL